jgi:hypothetical protein
MGFSLRSGTNMVQTAVVQVEAKNFDILEATDEYS